MKVLMLAPLYTPLTGGAETYLRLLAEGLAAAGHEPAVATDGSWLPGEPSREVRAGVEVIRLHDFASELDSRDKVRWRRMQYAVLDELAGRLPWVPDLIHANSHETLLLGSMIALEHDLPLVASLHEQKPDLLAFGRGRCRLAYSVLPVDAYLAGSEFFRRRAVAFGAPEDRLHMIYHGVAMPELSPATRERGRRRLGVAAGVPLIVCPARIDPRKGQADLVLAFARVREQVPDARLVLAGRVADFATAAHVRQLIQEHALGAAVDLIEDLTDADMPEVLAAADIVAQPSLEEGLGLAAIEAMSWARPVVASDVVGLEEVFTHEVDGLLTPAQDPERLAGALLRVLREPGLGARLGAAARQTVAERFSQATMVRDTLSVYAAATARRREGLQR
jgi:glycosyltransferase involved in cell wall biosynthesis